MEPSGALLWSGGGADPLTSIEREGGNPSDGPRQLKDTTIEARVSGDKTNLIQFRGSETVRRKGFPVASAATTRPSNESAKRADRDHCNRPRRLFPVPPIYSPTSRAPAAGGRRADADPAGIPDLVEKVAPVRGFGFIYLTSFLPFKRI